MNIAITGSKPTIYYEEQDVDGACGWILQWREGGSLCTEPLSETDPYATRRALLEASYIINDDDIKVVESRA